MQLIYPTSGINKAETNQKTNKSTIKTHSQLRKFKLETKIREATKTQNIKQYRHSLEVIFQLLCFKSFLLGRTIPYLQEA